MFAALFSVLLIASEAAATVPVTPQAPVTNEAAEPAKKICKRQPVTGQLQGTKRICMTADQWKAAQESVARAKR